MAVAYLLQSLAHISRCRSLLGHGMGMGDGHILTPLNATGPDRWSPLPTPQWPRRLVVTGSTHAFDHARLLAHPNRGCRASAPRCCTQRDPECAFHPNRAGHFFGYALPLSPRSPPSWV